MTLTIFRTLRVSAIGSALRTTRSAAIPVATVPRCNAWPTAIALTSVAARIAASGLKPVGLLSASNLQDVSTLHRNAASSAYSPDGAPSTAPPRCPTVKKNSAAVEYSLPRLHLSSELEEPEDAKAHKNAANFGARGGCPHPGSGPRLGGRRHYPPRLTCEDSLAQQISVTGLNPALTATYPLSSPIVPAMGFATEDMSAAIDATVVNFMNQYGIPGGVVAMTYNNQLIFAKSYGYSDVDNAVFTQPDSRMRVASISKSITAMGILKLVHDDPVLMVGGAGWLLGDQPFLSPAFGTAIGGKLQSWIGPITVDELLHHAGGWAEDYENSDTLMAFEKIPGQSSSAPPDCHTLLRYVESRAKTKSDLAPGTAPLYSNIGFCALSEVIHQQSGVDFSDYIQTNVLAPLGMTDTALGSTPDPYSRIAKPGTIRAAILLRRGCRPRRSRVATRRPANW